MALLPPLTQAVADSLVRLGSPSLPELVHHVKSRKVDTALGLIESEARVRAARKSVAPAAPLPPVQRNLHLTLTPHTLSHPEHEMLHAILPSPAGSCCA